jgi:IS30 family transposase
MRYHQITPAERYTLVTLLRQAPRPSCAAIARLLGRHRSTIARELRRNGSRHDGSYRLLRAQEQANGRRSRSRRKSHFTDADWQLITSLLRADLSPEQISGRLRVEGRLEVSHETIYQYIWRDKHHGGQLYRRLRHRPKYRKRYGTREKRGKLPGKRHISERPRAVERRRQLGHWEIDTVVGTGTKDCIVSLVERSTGFVLIGKLHDRTVASLNRRAIELIRRSPAPFRTITADNGTEFHGYRAIEDATNVSVYFATPYHSWERGTNENTNGLIRQYLPKRTSMKSLTQAQCNEIARILNDRPRKRHRFLTPLEKLNQLLPTHYNLPVSVALQT